MFSLCFVSTSPDVPTSPAFLLCIASILLVGFGRFLSISGTIFSSTNCCAYFPMSSGALRDIDSTSLAVKFLPLVGLTCPFIHSINWLLALASNPAAFSFTLDAASLYESAVVCVAVAEVTYAVLSSRLALMPLAAFDPASSPVAKSFWCDAVSAR